MTRPGCPGLSFSLASLSDALLRPCRLPVAVPHLLGETLALREAGSMSERWALPACWKPRCMNQSAVRVVRSTRWLSPCSIALCSRYSSRASPRPSPLRSSPEWMPDHRFLSRHAFHRHLTWPHLVVITIGRLAAAGSTHGKRKKRRGEEKRGKEERSQRERTCTLDQPRKPQSPPCLRLTAPEKRRPVSLRHAL